YPAARPRDRGRTLPPASSPPRRLRCADRFPSPRSYPHRVHLGSRAEARAIAAAAWSFLFEQQAAGLAVLAPHAKLVPTPGAQLTVGHHSLAMHASVEENPVDTLRLQPFLDALEGFAIIGLNGAGRPKRVGGRPHGALVLVGNVAMEAVVVGPDLCLIHG